MECTIYRKKSQQDITVYYNNLRTTLIQAARAGRELKRVQWRTLEVVDSGKHLHLGRLPLPPPPSSRLVRLLLSPVLVKSEVKSRGIFVLRLKLKQRREL